MSRRSWLLLAGVLVGAAVGVSGCGGNYSSPRPEPAPESVPVAAQPASKRSVPAASKLAPGRDWHGRPRRAPRRVEDYSSSLTAVSGTGTGSAGTGRGATYPLGAVLSPSTTTCSRL